MDYTGFGLHYLYNLTVVQIVSKTTISSHKIKKRFDGQYLNMSVLNPTSGPYIIANNFSTV